MNNFENQNGLSSHLLGNNSKTMEDKMRHVTMFIALISLLFFASCQDKSTAPGLSTKNYIVNGGFEEGNGKTTGWISDSSHWGKAWGRMSITDSIKKEGNICLHMVGESFSEYGISGKRARIFVEDIPLQEGRYKLSFWVKVEGIPKSSSTYNWYSIQGTENYIAGFVNDNEYPIGLQIGDQNLNDWVYKEKVIEVKDLYYKVYGFNFDLRSYCENTWFDDIRLTKVE